MIGAFLVICVFVFFTAKAHKHTLHKAVRDSRGADGQMLK